MNKNTLNEKKAICETKDRYRKYAMNVRILIKVNFI